MLFSTMNGPMRRFLDKYVGATTQIVFLAMICFSCPGIFNSLNALGGAGQSDPKVANYTNSALYACFAVFGYAGGFFFNLLGNKILLGCGGLTYVFYVVCQYVAARNADLVWLAVLSGAVLGIGAGLFWTAQGAMMLVYPTESRKGVYIAIVWVIFNLGGVIGGLAAMGINFDNTSGSASPTTYFTFAAIMLTGSLSAFVLLVPPSKVIRSDGTAVTFHKASGMLEEMNNVARLFCNPIMLLLTPIFVSSNWFYTYQFNAVNGALFTTRARGLNSACYWAAQMLGATLLGHFFLDWDRLTRRSRAVWALCILTASFSSAWAIGTYLQLGFEGGYDKGRPLPGGLIDLTDTSRFFFPWFCFIWYGFNDALLQTYVYWLMGASTNNTAVAARYAGYYKGVQSAGAAIAWALDNTSLSWLHQLIINWVLFSVSVPFTYCVAYYYVTNSTGEEEIHIRKQIPGTESSSSSGRCPRSIMDFHDLCAPDGEVAVVRTNSRLSPTSAAKLDAIKDAPGAE